MQKRGLKIDVYGSRSSSPGVVASVFGSTGFLGRNVVGKLCSVGIQTVLPFRGEEYNMSHLKVLGDIGQNVPQLWDLRDPDSIYEAVKHSNLVVNLVAQQTHTRHFNMNDVNIDGARLIARIAREAGVERFIHVSTAGYNIHSCSEWIRSKSLGEQAVREIFPSATIIRPTTMFGIDDTLLTRPAELFRFSPVFPVYRPDRKIQPIWVDDVARAILETAADDNAAGKVFEIGGPEVMTQRQLYEFLSEILYERPQFVEGPVVEWFVQQYAKFWSKIHRNPRWTPHGLEMQDYDNIVTGTQPGFEEIGIGQDELTSVRRYALNVVRQFRHTERYDNDLQETWVHPPTYKNPDLEQSQHHVPIELKQKKPLQY